MPYHCQICNQTITFIGDDLAIAKSVIAHLHECYQRTQLVAAGNVPSTNETETDADVWHIGEYDAPIETDIDTLLATGHQTALGYAIAQRYIDAQRDSLQHASGYVGGMPSTFAVTW